MQSMSMNNHRHCFPKYKTELDNLDTIVLHFLAWMIYFFKWPPLEILICVYYEKILSDIFYFTYVCHKQAAMYYIYLL